MTGFASALKNFALLATSRDMPPTRGGVEEHDLRSLAKRCIRFWIPSYNPRSTLTAMGAASLENWAWIVRNVVALWLGVVDSGCTVPCTDDPWNVSMAPLMP